MDPAHFDFRKFSLFVPSMESACKGAQTTDTSTVRALIRIVDDHLQFIVCSSECNVANGHCVRCRDSGHPRFEDRPPAGVGGWSSLGFRFAPSGGRGRTDRAVCPHRAGGKTYSRGGIYESFRRANGMIARPRAGNPNTDEHNAQRPRHLIGP